MAKLLGRNLKVLRGGTAIGCARSCELSIDTDLTEIADASTGAWKKYRAGKKGWGLSVSGLVSVSDGFRKETDIVGTEATLTFENVQDSTVETVTGTAICKSAKITGTIGNLAQWSMEFTGSGALS